MRQNKQNSFWPAYADLMTSLFFVMLILFVLSFAMFKYKSKDLDKEKVELTKAKEDSEKKNKELLITKDSLTTTVEKLKKIVEIDSALVKLNNSYFRYNNKCKRHELKVDIQFQFNKYDLNATYLQQYHSELIKAGRELATIINNIKIKDNIKYLLVIEGRAGRYREAVKNRQFSSSTKDLSFARAKSLYDFWKQNNITFNKDICEVIIAGSGLGGQCRYEDEIKNRRFVIQILPKVGKR